MIIKECVTGHDGVFFLVLVNGWCFSLSPELNTVASNQPILQNSASFNTNETKVKIYHSSYLRPRRTLLPTTRKSCPLEPVVEPRHVLKEGGLLGELGGALGDVATKGEAVLAVGVDGDLVGNGHLLEDVLGLPTLVEGEDNVGFWVKN